MSLGALIIETSIVHVQSNNIDAQIAKKSKTTHKSLDNDWIKLAEYVTFLT